MADGSGVSLRIDHQLVEYLPGAVEAAGIRSFSGGLQNNKKFLNHSAHFASSVSDEFQALLFDPQTSGGLLVALAPGSVDRALEALRGRDVQVRVIGEALTKQATPIEII
jgi:selenide,water dikinase